VLGVGVRVKSCTVRVPRKALPINLFRHFCCSMYRLATMYNQTDKQTADDSDCHLIVKNRSENQFISVTRLGTVMTLLTIKRMIECTGVDLSEQLATSAADAVR